MGIHTISRAWWASCTNLDMRSLNTILNISPTQYIPRIAALERLQELFPAGRADEEVLFRVCGVDKEREERLASRRLLLGV